MYYIIYLVFTFAVWIMCAYRLMFILLVGLFIYVLESFLLFFDWLLISRFKDVQYVAYITVLHLWILNKRGTSVSTFHCVSVTCVWSVDVQRLDHKFEGVCPQCGVHKAEGVGQVMLLSLSLLLSLRVWVTCVALVSPSALSPQPSALSTTCHLRGSALSTTNWSVTLREWKMSRYMYNFIYITKLTSQYICHLSWVH